MADDDAPTPDESDAPKAPTAEDVTRLKEALRKERETSKRATELEKRLKELEDADKSETQKLRDAIAERDAQIADLPQQARRQAVRFASEAARQGFLDPEDAFAFLPSDLDLDDSDAVKAALTGLAERKPHLVRKQTQPKVPARPTAGAGEHLGSTAANEDAKERAAAALRAFRST